jgi:hypothetical protein
MPRIITRNCFNSFAFFDRADVLRRGNLFWHQTGKSFGLGTK